MAAVKNKNESNKKAHFNVIDACIIVLIVAIILGIYFRFNIVDKLWEKTQTKEYAVSFSIENIRYTTPSYMNIGDVVYFADSKEEFGTLITASDNVNVLNIVPASEYFPDGEGGVIEVFYPDDETRIDARGRLSCFGYYDENGGFTVGGTHYIAPGQSVNVCTETVTVTMTITNIELIAAGS